MKRKHILRKSSLTMIFSLLFLIICSTASFASGIYFNATCVGNSTASTITYHAKGDEIFVYPNDLFVGCFDGKVKLNKVKFMKPTSSKTSVATIDYYDNYMFRMVVKKSGTTTIKLKYKVNGKTITTKVPVTFKKKSTPFTKLKVGDKDLLKKGNYVKVSTNKAKLTFKLKKDWKITMVWVSNKVRNRWYELDGSPVNKTIKNGSSIPIKKGDTQIFFTVSNKKTNEFQKLVYHVHR